jgi:hypothetical protein
LSRIDKVNRILQSKGSKILLVENQNVEDIVTNMLKCIKKWQPDFDSIAHLYTDEKQIWDDLKRVKYYAESTENQRLVSPATIFRGGTADCKSYALYSSGILNSKNYKGHRVSPIFRIADYGNGYCHVYTIGRNIIDATLRTFGYEESYIKKKDYGIMGLYAINGKGKAKLGYRGVEVTLFVPRQAFYVLVMANVFGFKTKLQQACSGGLANYQKVMQWWWDLGGDEETLARKLDLYPQEQNGDYPFLGHPDKDFIKRSQDYIKANSNNPDPQLRSYWKYLVIKGDPYINSYSIPVRYGAIWLAQQIEAGRAGFNGNQRQFSGVCMGEPVTFGAAIATAAPIVFALIKMLKSAGVVPEDMPDDIDKIKDGSAFSDILKKGSKPPALPPAKPPAKPPADGGDSNTTLYIGAGLLLLMSLKK